MIRWAFTATFFLVAHSCQPLSPSGERASEDSEAPAELQFNFKAADSIVAESVLLVLEVYATDNEEVAPEPEIARTFELGEDFEERIKLTLPSIGPKEVVGRLKDRDGFMLGEGRMRLVILPGINVPDEQLVIQLVPVDQRSTDVSFRLKISILPEDGSNKTTYLQIEPLLQQYQCVPCHNYQEIGDFTQFPWKSSKPDMTFERLVVTSMLQMEDGRMPKDSEVRVPLEEIDQFDYWLEDGLLEVPPSSEEDLSMIKRVVLYYQLHSTGDPEQLELQATSEPGEYVGTVTSLPIAGSLTHNWSVLGNGDIELGRVAASTTVLTAALAIQQQLVIEKKDITAVIDIIIRE